MSDLLFHLTNYTLINLVDICGKMNVFGQSGIVGGEVRLPNIYFHVGIFFF